MKTALILTMLTAICASTLVAWPAAPRTAAQNYSKYCSSCHGKDGRAKTLKAKFNHARDLTDRTWHDGVSDERLFNSIMNGKGKNMPGYSKKLSAAEIEALVVVVRAMKK